MVGTCFTIGFRFIRLSANIIIPTTPITPTTDPPIMAIVTVGDSGFD